MSYIGNTNFELEVTKGKIPGHINFEKFGKNNDIDTGTTPQDIWNGGGDYTGFPTGSAETMEIFSSDVNDNGAGTGARTATIYNLTDDTGAEMPNITVTLNGTTAVSLGAGLYYRGGSRIKVITAGTSGINAGTITLRHTTTTTNIFAVMPIGLNQTVISAFTVPLGKTLYINRVKLQMSRLSGAAGSAVVSLRSRKHGGVFNTSLIPTITNSDSYSFENNGWLKYEERTDVKTRCEDVSDNNTTVIGEFNGILIDN
ncbi:MAG: hypothetical protein ACTSQE_14380 [Candidatus Heimdallarchaeaceae archaeon]